MCEQILVDINSCCSVKLTITELKISFLLGCFSYTVPQEIDFPLYNMKCGGENVMLRGIFYVL